MKTEMSNLKCFECQMQHPDHKMGCGSKSRMDALVWLLDSLHYIPDDLLDKIHFAVWSESQDRKYDELFGEEEGEQ